MREIDHREADIANARIKFLVHFESKIKTLVSKINSWHCIEISDNT